MNSKEKLKPLLIDYIKEITKKSKGKDQYICPFCNSGTGRNGTGAFTYNPEWNTYHCFACGESGDIFTLYAKLNKLSLENDFPQIVDELENKFNILPSYSASTSKNKSESWIQLRTHIYQNMNHDNIAVKTIYRKPDGSKTAVWHRYEGNTLVKGLNGLKMPLYHIYNLTDNTKPIFIVEGEKDVETLEKLGYIATSSPNGAGAKWKSEYTPLFRDFDVIILADNDEVGLKSATNIAENIVTVAHSVKLIPSQALYAPLQPKGDISDIVECIGFAKAIQLIEGVLNSNEYIFTSKPSLELQQNILKRKEMIDYELFSEFIEKQGYSVRYNQITHNFEFFGFDKGESAEHLAENVPTILQDQLEKIYIHVIKQKVIDYITRYATRHKYNPVLNAIKSVKWDGKDRINEIYDIFKIPADTEEGKYSRIFIQKWLMQCVCGLFNNIDNPYSLDIILVFQGKQGIGKTRFFEMLALKSQYFGEGICLDPRDKDSIMQTTSKWIAELGEIGSTMRKDMDSVKAFLTKSTDEYRTPYGKASLHYPRITSFVGTVNDEQFLIDQTGNRRFVTVPLPLDLVIDYESQIKPFNALQLWSQIYEIVKDKDKASCFRLTEEEKRYLEKRNSAFVKPMKSECEVLDILQQEQTVEQGYICTTKDMTVTEFIKIHNLKYDANVVGRVLAKLGYTSAVKKCNGKATRVLTLPYKKWNGTQ